MKWMATEPERNVFTFSQGDTTLAYATGGNQTVRGHNLAWGVDNPGWLQNGGFNGAELQSILENHIANVAGHYNGKLLCWDVVNEAITDDDSAPDPLKTNVWYPALPNYIDVAFNATRRADPLVKLFYNDYGGEGLNPKSQRIYDYVKGLKARGVPIDGVGLQMHVAEDYYPPFADVKANIDRLVALGLEVHITEMDVKNTQGNLTQQAVVYGGMLAACLSNPGCKSWEVWGFTDLYSWLSQYQACIFDAHYQPKPAFFGLVEVLEQAKSAKKAFR